MANRRRFSLLAILVCLALLGFGVRAFSLDSQSMWRDEIDTFCFALGFWDKLHTAVPPTLKSSAQAQMSTNGIPGEEGPANETKAGPFTRPSCHPTPGLERVDPSRGFGSTLRDLLTLNGWNGPLYTLAIRPWIGLTGYTSFALRYSSLLFGFLAMPLSYVTGRRLSGRSVGILGVTLVALSPHLVWYSQEAKMYSLILTLALLGIYGFHRALDAEHSAGWWAVVIAATTLALYSHLLAALLIPLYPVLGLIWWPKTRRKWRGALISLACLTLPYLPLLAWQVHDWLLPAGEATLFTARRLDVMLEQTLDGWGGHFLGEPWATLVLGGLLLLALFGLTSPSWAGGQRAPHIGAGCRRRKTQRGQTVLAFLTWALLPLLGVWLISTRQPIFTNRYLIWAAPALYLLAALGFVALARQGWRGTLGALALLLIVLVGDVRGLTYQATQAIKPDFRASAAYVKRRHQPQDLIVFHLSYMVDNFDYYFQGEYHGWGAPAPGSEMPETDVDLQMVTNLDGHHTVWLVLSEPGMWDPRGLVKSWMDAHAVAAPEIQAFAHVDVYRYKFEP